MGYIPARTVLEWKKLMKYGSTEKNLIKTKNNWKMFLRQAARDKEHPLAGIDKKIIEDFTKSLVFRNGGLATAKYGELAKVLTYRKFGNLWARFGLDMRLFIEHEGYKCMSPGNCKKQLQWICTSNC